MEILLNRRRRKSRLQGMSVTGLIPDAVCSLPGLIAPLRIGAARTDAGVGEVSEG